MKIALTKGAVHGPELWELILICIFCFKISSLQLNFKGRSQTLCSDPFVHSPFCKQNSAREFNSKVSENITVKFIAPS